MTQNHSYRVVTLYSGSKGNAVYVRAGGTAILIDAGKSARRLCDALRQIGTDIAEIDAIFITHDHADHISALETLSKRFDIPIHMTDRSAEVFDLFADSPVKKRLCRHCCEYSVTVGELTVSSFPTPHDSRMSVGYRIEFCDAEGRHAVGVATDIGYVSDEVRRGLMGCEAVVLESNHDVDMLMKGPYPYELKKRIRSRRGHLSNADSAAFAAELETAGTCAFLLAHLSEENNEPSLAWEEAMCALCHPDTVLAVAASDCPTELTIPKKEERNGAGREADYPWDLEGELLERSGGGV